MRIKYNRTDLKKKNVLYKKKSQGSCIFHVKERKAFLKYLKFKWPVEILSICDTKKIKK